MSTTTLRQVPITCNGHTRPGLTFSLIDLSLILIIVSLV